MVNTQVQTCQRLQLEAVDTLTCRQGGPALKVLEQGSVSQVRADGRRGVGGVYSIGNSRTRKLPEITILGNQMIWTITIKCEYI